MQPSLLYRRNSLAFPVEVNPGFDPNHPAARAAFVVSVIPALKNYVDLTIGRPLTVGGTGSFGSAIDPNFGFATAVASGEAFADRAAVAPAGSTTQACFFRLSSTTGFQGLVCGSTTVNANTVLASSSGSLVSFYGNNSHNSGLTVTVGEPYFAATSSLDAVTSNFVMVNLRTGVTKFAAVANPHSVTVGAGSVRFCSSFNGGAQTIVGQMGAAMQSSVYLSLPQLNAWAGDPFAFWYPRKAETLIRATAATFLTAWAQQSNLPVLGTGVY